MTASNCQTASNGAWPKEKLRLHFYNSVRRTASKEERHHVPSVRTLSVPVPATERPTPLICNNVGRVRENKDLNSLYIHSNRFGLEIHGREFRWHQGGCVYQRALGRKEKDGYLAEKLGCCDEHKKQKRRQDSDLPVLLPCIAGDLIWPLSLFISRSVLYPVNVNVISDRSRG
jgi:hypothetical protein